MNIYIPILIVVVSNIFYHICTKSVPEGINTFAALTATYAVAAVSSLLLFFLTAKGTSLGSEYRQLNWSSLVLGVAIIGLEAGFILMYKVGWDIGTGQVVASALLAVVLIFVGRFLYGEPITLKRIIGIAVCLAGLYLLKE
ncbi:MAG: EamA family transporter [Oscillospiraceae bacterium]|nr:EamA family transporter [Oscillospiraceae bacterium]